MKTAVCLLSGGIDSTTTAAIAMAAGWKVLALTVDYGQRHKREIESARRIADFLGLKEHILLSVDLSTWGGSALTSDKIEIPTEATEDIPVTYVPARNLILLSLAISFAEARGALAVYFGANSLDYSGYPDCRPEFVEAFALASKLGTRIGTEKKPIKILAPLQNMTKAQIISRGLELDLDYSLTWSCYEGGEKACGKCDSCRIRLAAFEKIGQVDPLVYI